MATSAQLGSLDIARNTRLLPIGKIASKLGLSDDDIEMYGKLKAKIAPEAIARFRDAPSGKLVLVTAITPTPAGEGKTTTSVGLNDALCRLGRKSIVCLREPSVGPCFGVKGGGTGGGRAQLAPMEEINLHFNGDFHVVTAAHNLLAAMLDNHLHFGNELGIDERRIVWRRAMDMNDRSLRNIVVGLGGTANGIPRESGFDITPASEIMATLCFAESLPDLKERLGRIVVAFTRDNRPVTARDLKADGAMTALMRYGIQPNLVQTLENNPALVHGGPFANIAHGCSSVTATKLALRLAEFTITEAGFAADLGAEKFFNIKCRKAGLKPDAVVLVATVKALKFHGGIRVADLDAPDPAAVERGLENLTKHVENLRMFGVPVVVAINAFPTDTEPERILIRRHCEGLNVPVATSTHFTDGGAGAMDLADALLKTLESGGADFRLLYPDDLPLLEKIRVIVQKVYGGDEVVAQTRVVEKLKSFEAAGYGHYPVCMAKTQLSLSADPNLRGRPRGFVVHIRDVKLSTGPGFVVVLLGDIMTMPGLPRRPAAEGMDVDASGNTEGLF